MYTFKNSHITIATITDVAAIKDLLDSAYRGERSKRGWTSETHLIQGEVRTDENTLIQTMQQPGSVLLKYTDEAMQIIGCVNLQKHDEKLYLGMFAVSPLLQGGGIGKQLLQAAEEYAKHVHSTSIYMSVISVRTELINWYKRHGYVDTGEIKVFEENAMTGKHLQPLEFMTMEKMIE
jgi:ribosomal protein S18 acetylase RimI-like enzyme